MCSHIECPFYCYASDSCDYFLITGNRRPTPSKICQKYKTDFTGEDKPLSNRPIPSGINPEIIEKLKQKYVPGIDAKTLSIRADVDIHYSQRWLNRAHPEDSRFYRNGW